jgi:hypothetical protein
MSVHSSNTSEPPAAWSSRLRERLDGVASLEATLWTVAVVVMLLDVGLTDYGLAMGMSEVNPLGRMALTAFGSAGLLLAKLPVLAVAGAAWRFLPDGERWAVPLGLAVPWGVAVVLNLSILLSTV